MFKLTRFDNRPVWPNASFIVAVGLLAALGAGTAQGGELWHEAPEGVPGAVLVTSTEDGKAFFECVGYADLAAKRKMTPDTLFWMASNTKGIAAATALAVVGEGKLLLDDPVEKYFPSWKKLAAKERPTLRMLLSHTSGLPFFTDRPLAGPGMAALAERAAEQPLAYEPGTKYQYSNWGIDVAMAMVEKATGKPFDVVMAEQIFRPLGMTDTTFVPSADQKSRQAAIYRLSDTKPPCPTAVDRGLAAPYLTFGTHPEAGGGLLSTPRDMIRFFQMVANGGKAPDGTVIVPPWLMKAWLTKQTPASVSNGYSFGMDTDGKGKLSHGGQCGTWGEADATTKRARLFMVNVEGKCAAFSDFKRHWMSVTDLDTIWFSYPSYLQSPVATKEQREALIRELWDHPAASETKLWPDGKVPRRRDDKPLRFAEDELKQRNLVVTDVNDPFFVFYPAKGVKDAPVALVFPGGGYEVLGWNKEGSEVAAWLNANGVSAAVLLYRAPGQREAALCDAQRAIRLLRRDAAKYGIDAKKVGVIGFSAGANLVVATATKWRQRTYARVDDADDLSCRPDFQLPIYLWDVLERQAPDAVGTTLKDNGREPKVRAEYPVDAETPPAFVAQAKDDFCQIETSTGYFHALEAAGVKNCRLEVMASGNHGYGLRKLGRATDAWSDRAAAWLKDLLK